MFRGSGWEHIFTKPRLGEPENTLEEIIFTVSFQGSAGVSSKMVTGEEWNDTYSTNSMGQRLGICLENNVIQ